MTNVYIFATLPLTNYAQGTDAIAVAMYRSISSGPIFRPGDGDDSARTPAADTDKNASAAELRLAVASPERGPPSAAISPQTRALQ